MANQSKIVGRRGPDIHPYLRVAVIVLRLFYTTDFHDIAKKTGLDFHTAYIIWHRTVKRAGTDIDLLELLSHCGNQGRDGRPVRVTDGSPESEHVRQLLLNNPYSTFTQVIEQENLPYSRSLVERIAKQYSSPSIPRPIVRKTQQNKCYLDAADKDERLRLYD